MAEPVALAALLIEGAFGWPKRLHRFAGHPVDWFAALIHACERRWNDPARSLGQRMLGGVVTVAALVFATIAVSAPLQSLLEHALGGWSWIGIAVLAAPGLAFRSLHQHVGAVAHGFEEKDIAAARDAVGHIVGRDTAPLDENGVARAAIESLSESFCDGVVAPFFWLLLCGLPGIWVYKAINTADSLIGHREERWRAFGWAAARSDDLLNLVPARLSGLLICLAGGRGWRTLFRDAGLHASPNSGWPEAAMAGALRRRLAGPVTYDGIVQQKAWIGQGFPSAQPEDVRRSLAVYFRACIGLTLLAAASAWLLP